jgi:hypothetical protein
MTRSISGRNCIIHPRKLNIDNANATKALSTTRDRWSACLKVQAFWLRSAATNHRFP